jgi:hypothetical protein
MYSNFSISDVLEENGNICDIKYKDMALPIGLLIDVKSIPNTENIHNEYNNQCIDEMLFTHLLKNEKTRKIYKKTRKNKPLKFHLSLKNKYI